MSGSAAAACGLCFAAGCLGLFHAARAAIASGGEESSDPSRRGVTALLVNRVPRMTSRQLRRLSSALVIGLAAGLLTGWIVAVPIGVLAGLGLPALFGSTSASGTIAKIEAIATWTEMLQATLAASAGLNQAIVVTAPLSPLPVRAAAVRLATLLDTGAQPRDALLRFADEVGDPSADRVVCALLLSYESRGQRLGDLLSALAASTRDEVTLRLRVETSRSSVRSSVRTVLVFSVAFAAGLLVLARSYLEPFGTQTGQLVLGVIALLYAAGLWTMVVMARPPRPVRLLGRGVELR